MKNIVWADIIHEMTTKLPLLSGLCLAVMLGEKLLNPSQLSNSDLEKIIPRLGMVYAILNQTRNRELSLVQRVVSMILYDNISDQKVFDRLQPLGLSLSYGRSLDVVDAAADESMEVLIDAVKDGKRFRLAGDNVNWMEVVAEERLQKTSHMRHAFGSLAVVQDRDFSDLDDSRPQQPFSTLCARDFLPSMTDWQNLKNDYLFEMVKVVAKRVPILSFVQEILEKKTENLKMDKIVGLKVQFKNENKVEDCVAILNDYEALIQKVYLKANMPVNRVHIGGDQLTRERFSAAKRMRIGAKKDEDAFNHLGPITFEFFHFCMAALTLVFKHLYNEDSIDQLGTMKSAAERLNRKKVDKEVKKAYQANKDFFLTFLDAHIEEAVLEHFEMEDNLSNPTLNLPPHDQEERKRWTYEEFGAILDKHVFVIKPDAETNVKIDGKVHMVHLVNANKIVPILLKNKDKPVTQHEDGVLAYAQQTLSLGLWFRSILTICKTPDRDQALRMLKLSAMIFKTSGWQSKYASECLRLLVHQIHSESLKSANEEFYGLFVNLRGRKEGHVPVDEVVEWNVNIWKKHIRHMCSNKNEDNIIHRTLALPVISDIGDQFDLQSKVIIRSKKHSVASQAGDNDVLKSDLRSLRPFLKEEDRYHISFKGIASNVLHKLPGYKYHTWIYNKIFEYAHEKGN